MTLRLLGTKLLKIAVKAVIGLKTLPQILFVIYMESPLTSMIGVKILKKLKRRFYHAL